MPRVAIPDLAQGRTVYGTKLPHWWVAGLEQRARTERITREGLVAGLVAKRTKELGFALDEIAADSLGMSRSQYVRDTLEKVAPEECPPIREYRGDGARFSTANRKPVTVTIKLKPQTYGRLAAIRQHYLDTNDKLIHEPTVDEILSTICTRWITNYNLPEGGDDEGNEGQGNPQAGTSDGA